MITVRYRAFTFLQEKLKAQKLDYYDAQMRLEKGATVRTLILNLGFELGEVEAAFVNGRVRPVDTVLQDGDRVGLVPPGMPGPHRVLMGVYRVKPSKGT
ncbi:MAG: hypothetical protein A3F84_11955 [Candidatus Handelsmanbacteria bacterium RIFCSPLOWO2_12_FULL_64_10]|uniref:Thiamine biosynthesis protein ThiS n=1 Tax=Handelsmanbacteria sp. (strain RIFCSPLOWO2_12_FULL_64_10) TaxID=1817868 RepID=A0A1F6CM03_HANXR|nr:MAG: hypothetical protein A3F84_11955 [Candidatus Handelsmanbacteria bacterium RIFCSPLOWO2_12_FULL_64_10]